MPPQTSRQAPALQARARRADALIGFEPDAGGPADGVPITEAARLLGVPMPTLRSWERRYGLPDSPRRPGSHRRYSATDLHGLRLMRDEIARGKQASAAASSVRELLAVQGPAAQYVAAIMAASQCSDPAAVRHQLSLARTSLGLSACLDDVLLPALQQVGLWWQTGRCDVEQEHLTTEATRAWLESVSAFAPAPTHPQPVVLACGPSDLHTVGLEALGVLLRYRHWACRLLGARTAVEALVAAVRANEPAGVVVVSHLNTGRQRAIAAVRSVDSLGIPVFYAGNAFGNPRSRRNVGGQYLGARLEDACALIDASLGAPATVREGNSSTGT